jgi:hypothetical protein
MGFWNTMFGKNKKPVSDEIKAARERLGIQIDEDQEKEEQRREPDRPKKRNPDFDVKDYDPWEDLKDVRTSFWIGGWAAKRLHWRPNTDKLRDELEEVARKREAKEQQQWEQAEGDPALRRKLEEVTRKREEKERKRLEKEEELKKKLRKRGEKW